MTDRCGWCGEDALYIDYHDTEWGVPEWDSRALWEKLILDGFQAGLAWITILRKRDNFREAFNGFDPNEIATWGETDVQRLLGNPGIVRHRGKIEATIGNARAWQRIEQEQGFDHFMWDRLDWQPLQNTPQTSADVPAETDLSKAVSKELKKAGFRFCGPTIVYAWMQACGLINDHLVSCHRQSEVAQMKR